MSTTTVLPSTDFCKCVKNVLYASICIRIAGSLHAELHDLKRQFPTASEPLQSFADSSLRKLKLYKAD